MPVPVTVKDETLYYDKGPDGAHELHFLTPEKHDIDKATWDAMREGMFCLPGPGWGDIDKEIGQLCSQVHCDYQMVQALNDFFLRIQAVQSEHEQNKSR